MRILPDMKFNLIIFIVAILNFVLMFIFEVRVSIVITLKKSCLIVYKEYIIENNWICFKRRRSLLTTGTLKNTHSVVHHIEIENTLRLMPDWPPIFATTTTKPQHDEPSLVYNNC